MSLQNCNKNIFGFGYYYTSVFASRLEVIPKSIIYDVSPNKWTVLFSILLKKFPVKLSARSKFLTNVFILDILQTYKGWRHAKGLPCRGQRTWTNGWSSFRSNLLLRRFKIKIAQKVYNQLPPSEVNTVYLAEQINLLWKVQWESEWKAAKKNRLRMQRQGGAAKADLVSMAKGNVISPQKLKKMNKKQKQALKKNSFTLGFDPGFTKKIIEDLYKTKMLEQTSRRNRRTSMLSLTDQKKKTKVKKKKVDIRAQKIKHNLKKKSKKSVWD